MLNLTPFLRLISRLRLARLQHMDFAATQEQQLLRLVRRAATTKFGFDHGFAKINSVTEYQSRVPVRSYEQFWNEYWKAPFPKLNNVTWPGLIDYYAVSSGTSSGATKYIPYTREIMDAASKAALDLLCFHVNARPESRIFAGRSFILTGSTDLQLQTPGVWSGDMSGICMKLMPWWAALRTYPPRDFSGITSWEKMIEKFARPSLTADITGINGAPSWMLLTIEKLKQLTNSARLVDIYPQLELLVHGGMNFAPYKKVFDELLAGSHAETREAYPASEGFMAVQDRGYGDGMRLVLDHGIFYEFIPVEELGSKNPTRHWIGNVQKDIDYAIILTTCAGLWSYNIGDMVRFVDTTPPRVLMIGRTSYMLSAVGEHLIGQEIEAAVVGSAEALGLTIAEFSVGARFPKSSADLAGHIFVVEFKGQQPSKEQLAKFAAGIDSDLQQRNEDYLAHRRNEFGLKPPQIIIAPPESFNNWMKSRGKFGGQNKVPRVINKQEIFDSLLKIVEG